ncbi:hypothetical protein TWF506_003984 [Arthrobotrys conoides]|uniref:NACHT domain-containing protein n=1 Tax=Arthrobotrys conoides TaxID=74498 RepID=A0AAN8RPR0_9PEZI
MGSDTASDVGDSKEYEKPKDDLEQIREWLDPTAYDDPGSDYKRHSASHLAGTGEWLFSSEIYQNWHSSGDDGLLWIRGIPGSGKSVFAANLINRLKEEDHPVLYFFFRQIIDANHSAAAALRDWLAQMCILSPEIQKKMLKYIEESQDLERLPIADLWGLIRDALSQIPKAYIVVDALDEMDQNQGLEPFLLALAELGEWQPSRVKVIMTSRPIARIERCLRTAKILDIRLEEAAVDVDIAAYVRHRLKDSNIPMDVQVKVEAAVPGRANGLFLFAKLALDAVLQPNTDVEIVIQQLAKDLNNIYADLLKEHSKRSGIPDSTQLLILQSVTHATRPLRLLEIADMVKVINNVEHGEEMGDLGAVKDLVRSACGPLLEILPDETVSVVHHSLTEFLNGATRQSDASDYPILEPGPTHNRLALVCLSYLKVCLSDPENDHLFGPYSRGRLHLLPPFTQYAALNWWIHVKKAALTGYDQTDIHGVLDSHLSGKQISSLSGLSTIDSQNPLEAAVKLGLANYTKYLLHKSPPEMLKEWLSSFPLYYASERGYEDIVEMLLAAGVDVNERQIDERSALMVSTKNNHMNVVKLLTSAGADPFVRINYRTSEDCKSGFWFPCNKCESAFELAARFGRTEAMAIFASLVKTPDQANSALSQAVFCQVLPIVKILLEHPLVDVNSKMGWETPLLTACLARSADIIELLIQAGADPNIRNDYTPGLRNTRCDRDPNNSTTRVLASTLYTLVSPASCCYSCSTRYRQNPKYSEIENITRCYEILLAAGLDVNQKNENGNTVLHRVENASIASLLLAAGADPNAANDELQTPLHLCSLVEILEVLLKDPRVQIERKDHLGRTPLMHGLVRKDTNIILRLLDLGADATSVDDNGDGALHHFLHMLTDDPDKKSDTELLAKRLYESGANPRLQNKQGKNILHVLADQYSNISSTIFVGVLDHFLSVGADIEARDNNGQTPLVYFLKSVNHSSQVEERRRNNLHGLFKAGARMDTVDLEGKTIYHACLRNTSAWKDPNGVFSFINSNLSSDERHDYDKLLKQTDSSGNTVLHEACIIARTETLAQDSSNNLTKMIRYLKEQKISLSQPNLTGRTPLHIVCMLRACIRKQSENGREIRRSARSVLDYILKQEIDINHPDNDGITPLHLASTCCELTTSHLLAAGAKVSKATNEGLTPLHIAARCRQPNIVGMLLESLKLEVTAQQFLTVLNAKDNSPVEATALYYACASGHPATVELLLEAGATIDTPSPAGSPWLACASFEGEDKNWQHPPVEEKSANSFPLDYRLQRMALDDDIVPDACGFMLEDKKRPRIIGSPRFLARLEEILDLLVQHGPSSVKYIDDAINSAASNSSDYTVECLVTKSKALGTEGLSKLNPQVELCLQRREAQRTAFDNEASLEQSSKDLEAEFSLLMTLREYKRVIKILDPTIFSDHDMDEYKSSIIHDLLAGGFAFILRNILTASVLTKVDEWETNQQVVNLPEMIHLQGPPVKKPLLLEASKGMVPNMGVIQFLVEELGVDVNTQFMEYRSPMSGYTNEYVPTKSALHYIMTETRWWQYTLALPYLIQHGADTELRAHKGPTPLQTAVNRVGLNYISTRHAIRSLVSHGASLNLYDSSGENYLPRARYDMSTFDFLIKSGAEVTPSVLRSAVGDRDYDLLKALLSSGADPNTPIKKICFRGQDGYPLHYAADKEYMRKPSEITVKIIELLLEYGADLYAKYSNATVMHQLVDSSPYIDLLIDHPSIKLEERDQEGETILMKACKRMVYKDCGGMSAQKLVELLLDRGADIKAQSNDGRSALHHAFKWYEEQDIGSEVLQVLVPRAKEMIDVPDNNKLTPLHYALSYKGKWNEKSSPEMVNILLASGANPGLASSTGETALHLLCQTDWTIQKDGTFSSEKRRIFEQIVAMGVDVNARDILGETPLFRFFRNSNVIDSVEQKENQEEPRVTPDELPVLEMFDRANMDWKAISNAGETLLHMAAFDPKPWEWPGRAVKRFKFLLDKGIDIMAEDEQHRTALDIAATQNAEDILGLFTREPKVEGAAV